MEKKFNVPVTGPGSGFMASYLKFLQGERDTSPPPAGRGARKSTWSRTNTNTTANNKAYTPNEHKNCEATSNPQSANGAMNANNSLSSMPLSNPAAGAAGLLDDPRYYGLGKERKRKYEGAEEAYEAEEERRLKPVLNVPSAPAPAPAPDKGKKARAGAPGKPAPPAPAAPKKPRAPAPPPVAALQPAPQQQYYYQHQPEEGAFNLLDFHLRSRARW